jgi:hypothetical protein
MLGVNINLELKLRWLGSTAESSSICHYIRGFGQPVNRLSDCD